MQSFATLTLTCERSLSFRTFRFKLAPARFAKIYSLPDGSRARLTEQCVRVLSIFCKSFGQASRRPLPQVRHVNVPVALIEPSFAKASSLRKSFGDGLVPIDGWEGGRGRGGGARPERRRSRYYQRVLIFTIISPSTAPIRIVRNVAGCYRLSPQRWRSLRYN